MSWLQVLLALGAAGNVDITAASEVEVAGREIRLADVAAISGIDGAARAGLESRVIAMLPRGRDTVTLSRAAVASLVRRSIPGFNPVAGSEDTYITIRTAGNTAAAPADGSCVALSRPLLEGESLSSADVTPALCGRGAPAHLRFDRAGSVVRAVGNLAAGTPLGRLALPEAAAIDRGDMLTLVSTVGPVRIERKVVAVQPGRAGGRVFVRDEEGQILAAPLKLVTNGEAAQ